MFIAGPVSEQGLRKIARALRAARCAPTRPFDRLHPALQREWVAEARRFCAAMGVAVAAPPANGRHAA